MGWSLDLHTTGSTSGCNRTEVGKALYELKYQNDQSKACFLVQVAVAFLCNMDLVRNLEVVIPVPFSKKRAFQPVHEIAKQIGLQINAKADSNYVYKTSCTQMKQDILPEEKKKILSASIRVEDSRHQGRNVLLFDDLYCSGSTLEVVSQKLREVGKVKSIYVLTLTKTRTKR